MMNRLFSGCVGASIASFLALGLSGCGDDSDSGGESGPGGASHAHGSPGEMHEHDGFALEHDHDAPMLEHDHDGAGATVAHDHPQAQAPDDLPRVEVWPVGWTAIAPGGDTICVHGDPFKFFVRPGTVNRVLIEFRGGGFCWDEASCAIGNASYSQTTDEDFFPYDEASAEGVRDHRNARNPFQNWHHVYIPYCSGDMHSGEVTTTYGSDASTLTIHHKGAVNTRAVLNWVYDNFREPEKAFVAGCSAGGFASVLWSADVREHYKNAKVYHFDDSLAGTFPKGTLAGHLLDWNAQAHYPAFIPGTLDSVAQLFELIGSRFPDLFLSQYNPSYDDHQIFISALMDGNADIRVWSEEMRAINAQISASTSNFRSYIAPGWDHCVLPYARFYTVASGGVALVDWLSDVIEDRPVDNVTCGDDCGTPSPNSGAEADAPKHE